MTGDNAPCPEWWSPEPHACPFPHCFVCEPHEGAGTYPAIPPNVILGAE